MITRIKNERGETCLAIVLDNCDSLQGLSSIQAAIIWAIKTTSNDNSICGKSADLWHLADILEAMQLTERQLYGADDLLLK